MKTNPRSAIKRSLLFSAIAAAVSSPAVAIEFKTESGWSGSINTTLSYGASWRAEERDKTLVNGMNATAIGWLPSYLGVSDGTNPITNRPWVSAVNNPLPPVHPAYGAIATLPVGLVRTVYEGPLAGYTGEAKGSTGNMNYGKGDRYSEMFKLISDLKISKDDMGALIRVKAWYDNELNNGNVPWGNQATRFTSGKPLSDSGAPAFARFDGIELLDAYVYNSFDIGDNPAQVRIGRQALNWGESLFFQGVNQISPLDVTALRRAGTEIKEALLPIWAVSGSIGLAGGVSMEAFYQAKWEPSVVDGCGTYWAGDVHVSASAGACNMVAAIGAQHSNRSAYLTGSFAGFGNGRSGSDSGQYGVALRFPVESIDTEFGLYAMQINARLPILSYRNALKLGTGPTELPTTTGFLEYLDDIQIYGLSAATTLYGVSWGAELSLQKNLPVQISPVDLTIATGAYGRGLGIPNSPAVAIAQGPMGASAVAAGLGGYLQGYERHDKLQLQLNGIGVLPAMLGATNGVVVGELMAQWNDLPDYNNQGATSGTRRFGRAGEFGYTPVPYGFQSALYGALTGATAAGLQCAETVFGPGFNKDGCKSDGYMTDFAWGYRLRAQLDYPNVFETGIQVTPSIFWAHDVEGVSIDSQLNEGRKTLSLGLRLNKDKVHNLDLTYTTYSNSATYDPLRDRDNYSIAYSYTF
jgi:hypothetical protein